MKLELAIEADPDVGLGSTAAIRLKSDFTGQDTVTLALLALQQYIATAQEGELSALMPQLPEELTQAMSMQKAKLMLIDYVVHLDAPDQMIATFFPAD